MIPEQKPHSVKEFFPLEIAVLTVSDTRSLDEDTSGQLLVDRLTRILLVPLQKPP
jgi:molybdopterin biosynthesis enzyme MoaB